MSTLFERIQQVQSPQQPKQRGIESLLAAKKGKAGAGAGPKTTQLREGAALGAIQQAGNEQTAKERLGDAKFAGQQQAVDQQAALAQQKLQSQQQMFAEQQATQSAGIRADLQAKTAETRAKRQATAEGTQKRINSKAESVLRDIASQKKMKLDDIFSEFEASEADLEDREDQQELELLAASLALQDRKYLETLTKIGKERQLHNDMHFDNHMSELVMGQELSKFLKDRDFKTGQNQKRRDEEKILAKMDIDAALAANKAMVRDYSKRKMWENGTNIVTSAAEYGMSTSKTKRKAEIQSKDGLKSSTQSVDQSNFEELFNDWFGD